MDEITNTPAIASSVPAKNATMHDSFANSLNDLMQGNLTTGAATLVMNVVVPAGIALLMLIVTYFAAKLAARWVATALCARVDQTVGKFAGKLMFYAVLLVGGLTILQTAGMNITTFAAVLAAAGFAIGLAFQGTLSNFASGVLLLVFRPFKVGDFVSAAGVMGKVNEVDLFTTTLDTPDNRRLIIPNSSIAGTTIENITFHKQRRVDVTVGIAYAASLDATRTVLTACAETLSERIIHGTGRGYQILLTNLGVSSVEWTVRVWVASENFFAVKEALTAEIKRQLDLHGIEIPFPQMQLHFSDNSQPVVRASAAHEMSAGPKMNAALSPSKAGMIRPRVRGESSDV